MERLLGIDYGTHRVGIALSDPLGITAQALKVCPRNELFDYLRALLKEYKIGGFVLGMPLSMDGSSNQKSEEVKTFAEDLKKEFNIEVIFYDERFTTATVERFLTEEADVSRQKRKHVRDKLAACLILQGYLDNRRNAGNENKF